MDQQRSDVKQFLGQLLLTTVGVPPRMLHSVAEADLSDEVVNDLWMICVEYTTTKRLIEAYAKEHDVDKLTSQINGLEGRWMLVRGLSVALKQKKRAAERLMDASISAGRSAATQERHEWRRLRKLPTTEPYQRTMIEDLNPEAGLKQLEDLQDYLHRQVGRVASSSTSSLRRALVRSVLLKTVRWVRRIGVYVFVSFVVFVLGAEFARKQATRETILSFINRYMNRYLPIGNKLLEPAVTVAILFASYSVYELGIKRHLEHWERAVGQLQLMRYVTDVFNSIFQERISRAVVDAAYWRVVCELLPDEIKEKLSGAWGGLIAPTVPHIDSVIDLPLKEIAAEIKRSLAEARKPSHPT